MKHLEIKSTHYRQLETSFQEWLEVIGYASGTIKTFPIHLREFFHYLEQKDVLHISKIKSRHLSGFVRHLELRANQTHGGALSSSSINKTLQSINTFARYIAQNGRFAFDISARRVESHVEQRNILTLDEIKKLYEATFTVHRQNSIAIGQRDRAIIAIFYGCGLRKSEGTRLDLRDIDLIKRTVFVRKGKGNKQRYVPIAIKHADDIRAYLEEGREWFLENHFYSGAYYRKIGKPFPKKQDTDDEAFFLGMRGERMKSFYARFDYLAEKSAIERKFSTHDLRHSIATHLLQSGMDIEEIAKFLGHSSLESTQIYTHIINRIENEKDEPAGI